MRCNVLALLAFAALTTSAVLPANVEKRELDLTTPPHDIVERYEPVGKRLVIGGSAAVTGGGAVIGGAAISGGAAQTTGAQPTAAATSTAPTSGADIPYGSHLSRLFNIKIVPSPTTQPATSGSVNLISSLLKYVGSLLGSSSSSKGGQPTPTPSPAYLSSQGYPTTSQQDAGTFSIVEGDGLGYLVSVDLKTCRPSTNCIGYYSGSISDATTDIPPFHDLTLTSSFDEAHAASLNGERKNQTPQQPPSSIWRLNFWPFSNRGKPSAQPQPDPSLVLINRAFSTVGNAMIFGALVITGGQFSPSTQVFGTGSSTYENSSAFQAINLCIQYVEQYSTAHD